MNGKVVTLEKVKAGMLLFQDLSLEFYIDLCNTIYRGVLHL